MTIVASEIAAQRSKAALSSLARRKRLRRGLIISAYALVVAAATATAGLIISAYTGAFLLISGGLIGGLFVALFEYCRSELKVTYQRLDDALDAMAAARALMIENSKGLDDQSIQIDRLFHRLNEQRSRDIFGRQKSILYSRHLQEN